MKRIICFLGVCLLTTFLFSQTKSQLKELDAIQQEWFLDENQNLCFLRLIENLNVPEEELFERVLDFFFCKKEDLDLVIYEENMKKGSVVGEGFFENFTSYSWAMISYDFSVPFMARVAILNNRVRLTLSADLYLYTARPFFSDSYAEHSERIAENYPINTRNSIERKRYSKVFLALYQEFQKVFEALEHSLRYGAECIDYD